MGSKIDIDINLPNAISLAISYVISMAYPVDMPHNTND